MFVCGGLKGQLILNKKSWFSYQDIVIHEKQGPISTISFSYPFVAWCNEYGTKIYNVDTETSVMFVEKPQNVPSSNECKPRLYLFLMIISCRCWYGNSRLCIGWGETMTIIHMNFKSTPAGNKVWYGEQTYQYTVDFWISGMGVYDDDHITVLGYYPPDEDGPQPPSVHVLSIATGESLSEECLPLQGFEGYSSFDYQLAYNVTTPTSAALPLYLLSPHSVVRITNRSVQDHIDWAIDHQDFERAIALVSDKNNNFSNEHITSIKEQHLDFLFSVNKIDQAASLCSSYLGKDTSLWERWIAKFNGINKLQVLLPYIPLSEPRLPLPVYTLVLNYFLYNDIKAFLSLIRTWPKPTGDSNDLYDPCSLLGLLQNMQKKTHTRFIQEALAELYEMTGDYQNAVLTYLDGTVTNTEDCPLFKWIEEHDLIDLIKDRVLDVFYLNSKQASDLLVKYMERVTVGCFI